MSRSKVFNVEVLPRPNEPVDKLIKRFFKKCKKQEIIKEYLDKTSFARSKSQKRKEKERNNEYQKRRNERRDSKNISFSRK